MGGMNTQASAPAANAPGGKAPSNSALSSPPGGNVFDASAGQLGAAGGVYANQMMGTGAGSGMLQHATNAAQRLNSGLPNNYRGAAEAYNPIASGRTGEQRMQGQVANQFSRLGGRAATGANYLQQSADTLRGLGTNSMMRTTMAGYANPYQQDVIDQGVGRIRDERDRALSGIGGQAAQLNAFGGSRQGLLEAQVYEDANRNAGELDASMSRQGYLDRGQLAATDVASRQNSAVAQGQLGGNLLGQGMSALGQQAGINAGLVGQRIAGADGNMAVGGALQNRMTQNIQTQAQLAAQQAAQQQAGAAGATGLGSTMFGIGQEVNQDQMRSGMMQQGLNQQVLDVGRSQFDAYTQRPQDMLGVIMSGITGSPLQGNQTQKYTPGLFDYMSLGTQLGGSYMKGK